MSVFVHPIETLGLPTRMQSALSRLEIRTVGDLARRHPAGLLLERNLGRTTLAETRKVLESALGMRWEDAAEGDLADEHDVPNSSFVEVPLQKGDVHDVERLVALEKFLLE